MITKSQLNRRFSAVIEAFPARGLTFITTPAFGGHPVRTVEIDGETWFCAKDVFDSLDIAVSNVSAKLTEKGIPSDERMVVTRSQVKSYRNSVALEAASAKGRGITRTQVKHGKSVVTEDFPRRGLTFITAPAVRKVAHYSHKPAARAFRDFMNGTVAEAIEKDGAYVHPALAQQNPDLTAVLADMKAQLLAEMRRRVGKSSSL